jgi:6-pyruvoyltetrahydropterin/6-carboxytetrahydropterin synthase
MQKIRITKQFNFETAHALWNYDGKCKNIHGHTYKMFVTIIGEPNQNELSPKYGMVMDFGDLKRIIKENIIDIYDHTVILNRNAQTEKFKNIEQMFDRFIITDYQPTCENMVIEFSEIIKSKLPNNLSLHNLRLYETETSYAEWFAKDNK